MKKNIIIGVLFVVAALSLMYGFFQRAEAQRQTILAWENRKRADVILEELHKANLKLQVELDRSNAALKDAVASTEMTK